MLIDWFTVVAQLLNFFILVWLMKRFLYKPILNAIDEREKHTATELANADMKKVDAQKISDEFSLKNKVFDLERAGLLSKAVEDAQAEGLRLLAVARNVATALGLKQQETLKAEERALHQMVSDRIRHEVFEMTRKTLTDLSGMSLEERMVDVFIHRLSELHTEEKSLLTSTLQASPNNLIIRTTFELSAVQNAIVEGAIKKELGAEVQMRFETTPDLISGIELTSNGQKIAWSITDYLASLESGLDEILDGKGMADDKNTNTQLEVINQ
jgi:F-type H+-transporting ATPase subunit b